MFISPSKGYVDVFKHEVNFCCSLIDVNNPLNSDMTAQANTFEIMKYILIAITANNFMDLF